MGLRRQQDHWYAPRQECSIDHLEADGEHQGRLEADALREERLVETMHTTMNGSKEPKGQALGLVHRAAAPLLGADLKGELMG